MIRQKLQQIVGAAILGAGSIALSCSSGCQYQTINHIKGHEKNIVSQKDAPYNLESISLFGGNYFVQKDPRSDIGFALYNTKQSTHLIEESKRKVEIEAAEYYLAKPALKDDGELAEGIKLASEGKFAITAKIPKITTSEFIDTQTLTNPEYVIRSLKINGKEFYFAHKETQNKNKLNFVTIPRKEHKRKIWPSGEIDILNPGKIYEWIEQEIIQKETLRKIEEQKKAEEAEKQAEKQKKLEEEKQQNIEVEKII